MMACWLEDSSVQDERAVLCWHYREIKGAILPLDSNNKNSLRTSKLGKKGFISAYCSRRDTVHHDGEGMAARMSGCPGNEEI